MTTARNKKYSDRELAEAYARKSRVGEAYNDREKAAYLRVQAVIEDKIWDKLSTEISKARYERLSGRTTTQLHRAEKQYGIPVSGKVINLSKVAAWTHEQLASGRFVQGDDVDPMLGGGNSPALEKCRHEKWLLLQMERQQKEGGLIPVGLLSQCHQKMAAILKTCGETLERQHGAEAADILRKALRLIVTASDELIEKQHQKQPVPKETATDGSKPAKPRRKQPAKNKRGGGRRSKRKPRKVR